MLLETFDFNIIALIIAIFCIVFGAYYGFKRELKKSINFLLPLLIVRLFLGGLLEYIDNNSTLRHFLSYFNDLFEKMRLKPYYELYITLLVAFIFYVVMYLLVKIIISFIKLKPEQEILQKISRSSRIWGSVVSLVKGYFIIILAYFFCANLFVINLDKGVAKAIEYTAGDFSELVALTQIKNNAEEFDRLDDEVQVVCGRHAIRYYEMLVSNSSNNELNKKFISSLENEASNYKTIDLLTKYVEYVETNGSEKEKISSDIKNIKLFLKYSEKLFKAFELEFTDENMIFYVSKAINCSYSELEKFIEITSKALAKEDFIYLSKLFEDYSKNKDLYSEESDSLAYKYVLRKNPKISKIKETREKNIFISAYFSSCSMKKNLEGNKFVDYIYPPIID